MAVIKILVMDKTIHVKVFDEKTCGLISLMLIELVALVDKLTLMVETELTPTLLTLRKELVLDLKGVRDPLFLRKSLYLP